jgi:hypothetical protein
MISVLCMGVWFIAVSNHMEEARQSRRQLPRRVMWEVESECAGYKEVCFTERRCRTCTTVLAVMNKL